ncbi:oxidoreductase [Aliidongia dinghuensis]|uniref:Oxidoreductase n=1 Tax=Aliidongia dinghuensis TaxID=1867774 RepID=A0A8J2YQC5_9PROT|nr:Gfo/Idh/MocA family oxidoreductase [Aliidongia dinghuensis]GGF04269.1 oxidoreductase [Aliidongia dinghuensis]
MSELTIAVIGAGAIGRAHIETIGRIDACRLAGIAEPAAEGRALAERLGVPWSSDAAQLLDHVRPDAAIIATPNATHRAMALACIERGIPAIVEKPIASTLEDAAAIAAASDEARVPILVGHHRRYNPIIRQAHEMIAGGALGRLTNASVLYTFVKPPEYFDLAWRRTAGGGPILINLIHEIDLIRHLCGEIATVQALTSNAIRGFEVEDTVAVLLRLVNGALVTVSLSDSAATPWSWDLASGESPNYPPQPVPVQTHFIAGTEGSLALPTLEHWRYDGTKSWFTPITRETVAFTRGDPYMEQLHHLCRVVRNEDAPLIPAADGMLTLRATMAVHEAARTQRMVALD